MRRWIATLVGSCFIVVGCTSATAPREPTLIFRDIRNARGTWVAFELLNPGSTPIWIEGYGPSNPLARWEQLDESGQWVNAPGPISATGAEPELIPPRSSVWIKKRVFPEAQPQVLRLGVRRIDEHAGTFSDGNDIIWSTPVQVPASQPSK